ncbi:uncharacterized protein LOC131425552 [Malaya genurostris]|uniref:uncharacterized protein LOC131425552 n=1 Tax=Malaya genurostris TaxID=325434 RepID=UPI0026F390E1|nr:uncharacterized protein LOC131425552 [Malaya genurostris]
MQPQSGGTKILLSIVLMVSEFVVTEWVEIPFLQPSTTTPKTTAVIRKNINQPSYIAGSGLINHIAETEDAKTFNTSGKISDLIDYEQFVRRTTTTERPIVGLLATQPNRYANFQKRLFAHPRGNLTSSQELWFRPSQGHNFITANRAIISHRNEDHEPPSNKYEEESIEYLNTDFSTPRPESLGTSSYGHFGNHRIDHPTDASSVSSDEQISNESTYSIESPESTEQFLDFDDYDALQNRFRNVSSIIKRKRRPQEPEQVTIVRVIPSRRRLRPGPDVKGEGSFLSFLKFLKKMQDGFLLKATKNIGDKIRLLRHLRDQLLLSIENRITALWGKPSESDESNGQRRVKRGGWMDEYYTSGHGGMDFPSAEAALLTISFLTFAVFLIKLVLQVISTIKAKHYTYNTLAGVNGVSASTLKLLKRGKRDSLLENPSAHDLNIFSAINNYKLT